MDKLHFIEIKDFYSEKDMVNEIRRHARKRDELFAKHGSDKRLVSKIYKDLFKLNNNKTT